MSSDNSGGRVPANAQSRVGATTLETTIQQKALMNDIARDVVSIVAVIVTLMAFVFAVWATVATLRQSAEAQKSELAVVGRIERLEERILNSILRNQ